MRKFNTIEKIKQFGPDKSGNVFMMTAILAPVLFTAAGMLVDYSRTVNVRSDMLNSLDAAVLAAGSDLVQGKPVNAEFRRNFENFFFTNLEGQGRLAEEYRITEFTADEETGEISAKAAAEVPATLLRVAGWEEFDVEVGSSAIFSVEDVEISIMLDTTGSMSGQKLRDLQSAASGMVNTLLREDNMRGMKIAVVPYAGSVNVGSRIRNIVTQGNVQVAAANGVHSNIDTHGASNTCVTDRGGRHASTDASYRTARIGNDIRTEDPFFTCPRRAEVQPLTNRKNDLLRTIDRLEAQGTTAGHLGIAWTYYTLSNIWGDVWPRESRPAEYGTVRKIAVLMTDGEFNTFYHGTTVGDDPASAFNRSDESNELAIELCDDMKAPRRGADGITVYSIAFQAPESAEETLRDCASPDTDDQTFYFSAENGGELRDAFEEITANIQKLRLSQ